MAKGFIDLLDNKTNDFGYWVDLLLREKLLDLNFVHEVCESNYTNLMIKIIYNEYTADKTFKILR